MENLEYIVSFLLVLTFAGFIVFRIRKSSERRKYNSGGRISSSNQDSLSDELSHSIINQVID